MYKMLNKTVCKKYTKIPKNEKNERCSYINIFKRIVDMILSFFVGSKTLFGLPLTLWNLKSKIRFHSFVELDLENRLSTHNLLSYNSAYKRIKKKLKKKTKKKKKTQNRALKFEKHTKSIKIFFENFLLELWRKHF